MMNLRYNVLLIYIFCAIVQLVSPGCKNSEKRHYEVVTLPVEQLHKLFAENFSPFLNDMEDPTVKGDSATALDQFNIDYWTGHYQDAIQRFKTLDSTLQQRQGLKFRYANAMLADNQFDAARVVFQDIANHGPSLHANESAWYLALIEIHEGDVLKASQLLKAYRDSMNPLVGRQADNLLSKLQR